MSGVRQHFIPRFLQKGFKIPGNSKTIRCWVHKKWEAPCPTSTKDVGVERYFYAIESETALDDKITQEEENVYSPLLDKLRRGILDSESAVAIPNLLAHFEIRSRNLRMNMQSMVDDITTRVDERLDDPALFAALLEKFQPGPDFFTNELARFGVPSELIPHEQFENLLTTLEGLIDPSMSSISPTILEYREGFQAAFKKLAPSLIKQGHVEILNQSTSPIVKAQRYALLTYTVETYYPGNLPLGDSIVLFHVKGERAFKPFLDRDDEIIHVILPLNSDRYLLGSATAKQVSPLYDLPEQIASCSMEYFITSQKTPRIAALQQLIGTNSCLLPSEDMNPIIAQAIAKII
jgi:hypothetical protein